MKKQKFKQQIIMNHAGLWLSTNSSAKNTCQPKIKKHRKKHIKVTKSARLQNQKIWKSFDELYNAITDNHVTRATNMKFKLKKTDLVYLDDNHKDRSKFERMAETETKLTLPYREDDDPKLTDCTPVGHWDLHLVRDDHFFNFVVKDDKDDTYLDVVYKRVDNRAGMATEKHCFAELYDQKCDGVVRRFNNKFDQNPRILLANADAFSEGVDFKNAREIILVNPALSYSSEKQMIGRVFRACDVNHRRGSRLVKVTVCIGTVHDHAFQTADQHVYRALDQKRTILDDALRTAFKEHSVEYDLKKNLFMYDELDPEMVDIDDPVDSVDPGVVD